MIKYITINNKNDLLEAIKNIDISYTYDFEIKLAKDGYFTDGHNKILSLLIKNVDKFKNITRKIDFDIPYERVPKEEFLKLCKVYEIFGDDVMIGVNVKHWLDNSPKYDWLDNSSLIKESTQRWDIKTIIKANLSIDNVCEFIKNSKFSPLEALAFVHNYVSMISKYSPSNEEFHTWRDKDQFFTGAYLDLPEVVCAGYSSLMKEIIDSLKMQGLQCDVVSVEFENKKLGTGGGHARCLVRIKDEKYGIDQSCYDDPTWDCLDGKSKPKYAHFAMSCNCHDIRLNKKYSYYIPNLYKFMKSNAYRQVNEWHPSMEYNNSTNQIDQLMIEKVYFNVLQKLHPKADEKKLYDMLSKMAKYSFDEQTEREYLGYLKQGEPELTLDQAKEIFETNKAQMKHFPKNESIEDFKFDM